MQKICAQCGSGFTVTEDDRAFYEKISVPVPTWCPPCRGMRRMAWCNERVLYEDVCGLCNKHVISQFSPKSPRRRYCFSCWWSEKWDPMEYGHEVRLDQSIREQIHNVALAVPHPCTHTDLTNENSEYTHHAGHEKNCYMMFHTSYAEDCYYGYGVKKSKNCVDNHYCHQSELCYECIDVVNCYDVAWSQDCQNCTSSRFLRDCMGCRDCLFCTGLRQKQYCVLNEQLTKEEYEEKLRTLNMGSRKAAKECWKIFCDLQLKYPRKSTHTEMTENSSGDHLYKARDSHLCFDCSDIEYSKYCSQLQLGTRYCHDIYQFGINIELCYECAMIGYEVYNCQFCYDLLEGCSDLQYCMSCQATKNCFGCYGLKRKKYCILNRQYTQEEYERLREKIIAKMKSDGEFGEFLPIAHSQSAYNESMAMLWFPLPQDEVQKKGWQWEGSLTQTIGRETLQDLPDHISDVPDSITEEILACETCRRNYKIVPQELAFYRKHAYPVPSECFDCRRVRRMKLRNPRQLWHRSCGKCQKEIQTTYSSERPEKVYCEECYLKEVY